MLLILTIFLLGDDYTIRVTNLPEEATESDLMELFKPFGKVNRTFLAKDKNTQVSRGFAFVNFQNKDDAQRAIWGVNDYGYNHLILKVEWAKYAIIFNKIYFFYITNLILFIKNKTGHLKKIKRRLIIILASHFYYILNNSKILIIFLLFD